MSIESPDPPALVAALRHGLGANTSSVPVVANDVVDVSNLAGYDSLFGFLSVAILDGAIVIDDDDVRSDLLQRWHEHLLTCVVLEALIVRTAVILDGAGVNWRLTKGAALAHLDYPDPAVRTFGDVDLVIHPDHWTTALHALQANGYARSADFIGNDYDRRYGKGATLTSADGLELDLHRRFAIGRFGVTSKMNDVFEPSDAIVLAGRSIPVLAPSYRLLHACYHASLGGFRFLRALRDVAQLILVTQVDWEATYAVARRWQAEAVVASAVAESWQRLSLDRAHPAYVRAMNTSISRADERALHVFQTDESFRSQALTAVGALPLTEVPRYLWSLTAHHLKSAR